MLSTLRLLTTGLWLTAAALTVSCKDDKDPAPQAQLQTGALVGTYTPAAGIAAVAATAADGQRYTATLNATGSFAIVTLPVGTYTVAYTPAAGYRAPASQTATVTVNATTNLPPVTVEADRSIIGQAQPAGAVVSVTATAGSGQTFTAVPDPSGNFSFGALPAGAYTLTYTAASGYLTPLAQPVTVTANATTTLPALTVQPSRTTLLTAGRWHITALSLTDNTTGTVTDVFGSFPSCSADDFYLFRVGGTTLFDTGATKCNASDPQTSAGTWALTSSDTKLLTSFGSSTPVLLDIVQLTATTLQVRQVDGAFTENTTFTSF